MPSDLALVHHRPGRLRVRSDALCADADEASSTRAARVRDEVGGVPGVRSITHNARSGSILVEYVPGDVEPDAVVEAIARAAGLAIAPPPRETARRRTLAEAAIAAARELDAAAATLTNGRADLRALVPGAMVGLAAYSFAVKKDRLPRWDNLVYWAFALFHGLHERERTRGGEHESR